MRFDRNPFTCSNEEGKKALMVSNLAFIGRFPHDGAASLAVKELILQSGGGRGENRNRRCSSDNGNSDNGSSCSQYEPSAFTDKSLAVPMFICLYVYLPASLSMYLCRYLSVYLIVCLPVSPPACCLSL